MEVENCAPRDFTDHTENYYLLIKWTGEEMLYNIVRNTAIIDMAKRHLKEVLIGEFVDVAWGDEVDEAVILAVAPKRNMLKNSFKKLIEEAQNEAALNESRLGRGKRKKNKNKQFEEQFVIGKDIEQLNSRQKKSKTNHGILEEVKQQQARADLHFISNLQLQSEVCNNCAELKSNFDMVTQENQRLKKQLKKCQEKLALLSNTQGDKSKETDIDIGDGVLIPERTLTYYKNFSSSPSTFARCLFRVVFTLEELKTCSLFGKQCNANKGKEIRPALDERKVNAIFDFVLKDFPNKTMRKMMRKPVRESLTAMLKETRDGIKNN